tara:strand:- start:1275 stop:1478 length:204 start_codon:yes stop_codon:yes gene_type:complete
MSKKFNGFEKHILQEALQVYIEKAEQEISEQDEKPGKRFMFASGYFTMIGKELHDKVNQMTLKKYQD